MTLERLLELEFEALQRCIDKYDGSRFMIKSWAVTTSGALLAVSASLRKPAIGLAGLLVVVFFGYIELLYMHIQLGVVIRCNRIERLLDAAARGRPEPPQSEYRFGLSQAFEGRFKVRLVLATLVGRPHIYAFYLGLAAATAGGSVLLAG